MSHTVSAHTISALVQNESGTLNRLVSMFRRRSFSLSSLNAGDCEIEGLSRVTIVVDGDENVLRQCVRQLDKLIDVVEVEDLPAEASLQRELALISLKSSEPDLGQVMELLKGHLCQVSHNKQGHTTLEFSAPPAVVNAAVEALRPIGIHQVVRSGPLAIRVEESK